MEAVLVAHAREGRVRRALPRVVAALAARGVRVSGVHALTSSKDLEKTVGRAAKAGAPVVVVAGGDGAMTHAVGGLAHAETALGVIPLGTGNSFARTLGLPLGDIEAACDVIALGRVVRVDLGIVNETYFANFATIGLSSSIAGSASSTIKQLAGRVAYGIAAVVPLLRRRPFRAKLRYDGGKLDLRTEDIVVANGRYFGSQPVTPEASAADGRLAVFTAKETTPLGALRAYVAYGTGRATALPDVHVFETAELRVRTRGKQPLAIDGSVIGTTPAEFSVARRALRVLVGEGFDAR